jgi:hypothetical protein
MLIDTPQAMQKYIGAVMVRARHHGGNVTKAVKMLEHLVPTYGYDLQISDRKGGKIGNVSWFRSKATKRAYYFRYSHDNNGSIEMLTDNCYGRLVARFDNGSTIGHVIDTLERI